MICEQIYMFSQRWEISVRDIISGTTGRRRPGGSERQIVDFKSPQILLFFSLGNGGDGLLVQKGPKNLVELCRKAHDTVVLTSMPSERKQSITLKDRRESKQMM